MNRTKSYTYRADGKISSYQYENFTINYFYDGLGRLMAKMINDGNGNIYFNSLTYLADTQGVLLGKAGDGTVTKYIDGKDYTDHLGEVKNNVGKAYIADHLGSVLNGEVAGHYKNFGIYGEISDDENLKPSPATSAVNYAWQGLSYDFFTGDYDNHARRYKQNFGVFTSQDPLGFMSGEINYYGSRKNNPLSYGDISGRAAVGIGSTTTTIIGGIAITVTEAIAVDSSGNLARIRTECKGGGSGLIGGSASATIFASNAPTVGDLGGSSTEIGANANFGEIVNASSSSSAGTSSCGSSTYTLSGSLGVGISATPYGSSGSNCISVVVPINGNKK